LMMHLFANIIPDRHNGLAGMSVTCDGVQVTYDFRYKPATLEVLKKCRTSTY
jgi:Na+-transporting NADH:ubiquinone oxidoreductase subunit NqrC